MKSHKYWSLGALFCMLGCIYSGIKKSMTAHKYFAYSSLHFFSGFAPSIRNILAATIRVNNQRESVLLGLFNSK